MFWDKALGHYESFKLLESNSTSNVTHESIAATFPQFDQNVGSIVVSCVFLTCYAIVLSVIGGVLIRYRKQMKKNQIIVFIMVSWCIIEQSIALIFRLGYNGKALSLNLNYSDYTTIENLKDHFLPLYICSAIESLALYLQAVVIVVITCFILNMFLDTARLLHAMTVKSYKIFKYLFNIVIAIFAVIVLLLVFVHVGVVLASKVTSLKINVLPILIIIFVAFTVFLTIESLMFVFVGVKLILYVRKHSHKSGAQSNASFLQKPETKIGGLIIGMLLAGYFQLLAAIVGIITTTYDSNYHVINYSLQAGGILLFSIFVLLVYTPLVSFTAKESSDPKSERSEKSQTIKTLASQRKSTIVSPGTPVARDLDCASPTTTTSGGGDVSELSKV